MLFWPVSVGRGIKKLSKGTISHNPTVSLALLDLMIAEACMSIFAIAEEATVTLLFLPRISHIHILLKRE
jgi:hypothetical protein